MAKDKENSTQRMHKATYARDKKKGGYLIRIIGPNAADFAGRKVPVTRMDNSEHEETLDALIWVGIDEGTEKFAGTGKPCALYSFVPHPRDEKEAEF